MTERLRRGPALAAGKKHYRRLAFLWIACLLVLGAASSPGGYTQSRLTPPPLTPRPGLPPLLLPTPTPSPTVSPAPTSTPASPLPTPTATPSPTGTPSVTPTRALAEIITDAVADTLTHTPTPATPTDWVPLPTPTPSPTPTLLPPAALTPATTLSATVPSAQATTIPPTMTAASPASHSAEGSFFAQTVYPNGDTVQQQGSFTILRVPADNAYGENRRVTLTTRRADGLAETVHVYEVDDYSAIEYAGTDWVVVGRSQGSAIAKSVQPISDLADAFPQLLDEATLIGAEPIAGLLTIHYRIEDTQRFGPRLIRPLLATSGEIRSLRLDAWIDALRGHVVRYSFQMEIGGARVFDAAFNEVMADQAVTWTYQLRDLAAPGTDQEPLIWPANAPDPMRIGVPGFAPGDFPLPPQSRLRAILAGTPEWQTLEAPDAVAGFYRRVLTAQGWTVEGDAGLLECTKAGVTLILLITEDGNGGARFSLPAAP